jgi:hypothetical protein
MKLPDDQTPNKEPGVREIYLSENKVAKYLENSGWTQKDDGSWTNGLLEVQGMSFSLHQSFALNLWLLRSVNDAMEFTIENPDEAALLLRLGQSALQTLYAKANPIEGDE